jgi:hypothetical protein
MHALIIFVSPLCFVAKYCLFGSATFKIAGILTADPESAELSDFGSNFLT